MQNNTINTNFSGNCGYNTVFSVFTTNNAINSENSTISATISETDTSALCALALVLCTSVQYTALVCKHPATT